MLIVAIALGGSLAIVQANFYRIHHMLMGRNLNAQLPFADRALGTLATEVPAPSPTPEAARCLARCPGPFGRRLDGGVDR